MKVMHPIENKGKLTEEVRKRKISYTIHFEEDIEQDRTNISSQLIETYLSNKLEDLIDFTHKPDEKDTPRYNLIFDKSGRYYLLVALSFVNAHINLITSFLVKKERGNPEELVERWG